MKTKVYNFLDRNKRLLLILILFMFILTVYNPVDPDGYWHIKVGEYIAKNGIPYKDMFSYWDTGFISQEWLFDIFIYSIYSIFGYIGIVIVKNLFVFASLLIAGNINKEKKCGFAYLIPLTFYAYKISCLIIRPQVVSLLLIVIELYILVNNKNKLYIPILTLLCVNIHGGLCIILIFIYVLFTVIDLLERKTINWKQTIIAFALILVSCVITPYGYKNVLFGLIMPKIATEAVTEYNAFVQVNFDMLFLVLALIPLACMAYTKNAKLIDIVMVCMGTCLVLRWVRFTILYTPICFGFGCSYMHDAVCKVKDEYFPNFKIKFKFKYVYPAVSFALIVVTILSFSQITPFDEDESKFAPVIIKDYIEENNLDVKNNIMFNEYSFGGYFIFNNIPVFIDGRCEPYLEEYGNINVFPDYLDIMKVGDNVKELIEKYDIKYFAIYKDCRLERYLLEHNLATSLVNDDKYELLVWNGG